MVRGDINNWVKFEKVDPLFLERIEDLFEIWLS